MPLFQDLAAQVPHKTAPSPPPERGRSTTPPIERIQAQLLPDVLDLEGVVDGIGGRVAPEDAEDLLGDRGGHVSQGFFGLSRAMGREQDVGASDQGMTGGWRLDRVDVGAVAPEPAGV